MTHIPQTEIRVEQQLSQIERDITTHDPQWVIIDSFSVFLHHITDHAQFREKIFQMKYLLEKSNAIGLLLSDIPADAKGRLSRFGVEETVADGTIVLSTTIRNGARRRFIEVYKIRQTNHVKGQQRMIIGESGIQVLYQAGTQAEETDGRSLPEFPPVASLLQGDIRYHSTWLVRGEPGMGKSTIAMQFAKEGLVQKESVLLVTFDAPYADTKQRLEMQGIKVRQFEEAGTLRILDGYSGVDDHLDLTDTNVLLHRIQNTSEQMEHPIRIIFDSITPLSVNMSSTREFVNTIHLKNKFLQSPGTTLLDTFLYQRAADTTPIALLNGYDIVVDLYTVGEKAEEQHRHLQIAKSRDVKADATPKLYYIDPGSGINLVNE